MIFKKKIQPKKNTFQKFNHYYYYFLFKKAISASNQRPSSVAGFPRSCNRSKASKDKQYSAKKRTDSKYVA